MSKRPRGPNVLATLTMLNAKLDGILASSMRLSAAVERIGSSERSVAPIGGGSTASFDRIEDGTASILRVNRRERGRIADRNVFLRLREEERSRVPPPALPPHFQNPFRPGHDGDLDDSGF